MPSVFRMWIFLAFAVLIFGDGAVGSEGKSQEAEPVVAAAEARGTAASAPFAAPRDARFVQNEKKPLPRPAQRQLRQAESVDGWGWFLRVMFCLGALGVLAWAAMALARRYLPGGNTLFACQAIEILGRANLDPRRYVALIRIGRRVVLVGVSPEHLSHLTSIANPEEVAEILEIARPRTAAGKSLFQRLFAKYLTRANHEAHKAQSLADIDKMTADLTELRQRVRALHQAE